VIGDRLVITDYHRAGAAQVLVALQERLATATRPLGVAIAGESGSGKSETAHCLAAMLEATGKRAIVLGQDDYFRLPPKTNHRRRLQDISWVGPDEVRLELMDAHIAALKADATAPLAKPIIDFEADRINNEMLELDRLDVIVAEGTYTCMLKNVDCRAFINRSYHQTKKARLTRGRDPNIEFIENVLAIEHEIIRTQKDIADVVIDAPEEERGAAKREAE